MEKNNITFGKWEGTVLLINVINTKIFLNFPRYMAESAYTAGWILAGYVSLLTLIMFVIISKLYSKFEGKDLLDIGEYIGGGTGRIVTGSVVLGFLLYIVPVVLREFSEDVKVISLNLSPISFVEMFFVLGMIIGAYMGVETLVRYHAIVVPIIATGFLIIMIAVYPYYNLSNLFPILGAGTYKVFVLGSLKISVYSELIFLFLIPPFIKTHSNFKSIGYTAIFFSTIFMILGAAVFLMTFPYPSGTESFLPVYEIARLINFGSFFQRIESMFIFIWITAAFLYLSVGLFFIAYIFKKTFKLKYYKPLIIPFAIIVFNLSLLPQNLVTAIDLDTKYFRNFSGVVTFGFTILLLIIARLIKSRQKEGV